MKAGDGSDRRHDGRPGRFRRIRDDVVAGLVNAVVSVPDGLASAALAGVNPVYGLYTSIAAPMAGSALVSAQLMQVATTSASALAAGHAIAGYPEEQRASAMFLLVLLTGLMLVVFGLLKFGRLVRFVSHAVMTGFLIGVAAVLILDQLAPFVGGDPEGANEIFQFVDLVSSVRDWDPMTIAVGLIALVLTFVLGRTGIANFSSVIALAVPTLLVALIGWESVRLVDDVSPIPQGLPALSLPNLELLRPELVLSAFSLAVVIGVQGAGVSESVDNPDGSPVDASRDLVAQGAGNVAAGLLSGIPAGGSVGQTALNVSVGARSRWAGILGGAWMLVIVLLVPGLVGQVPMAVLAALMIAAGISAIDIREAAAIWEVGGSARWLIAVTFVATLLLSVPVAVAVGVGLSIVLFTVSSASDIRIAHLIPVGDGRFKAGEPPERLPSREVTVLDVYGSLFFAGARTLGDRLPSAQGAVRPAVVLRLRGRGPIGSTLVDELDEYAEALEEVGGRLYLTGVDERLERLLRRVGKLDVDATVRILPADDIIGASTEAAMEQATAWLAGPDAKEVQRDEGGSPRG